VLVVELGSVDDFLVGRESVSSTIS
jgi:hypothetical protein